MAALYHDDTRKREFADRARQLGPVSGPELCAIDLLEWSPGISLYSSKSEHAHMPLRDYSCSANDRDKCAIFAF